MGGRKKGRRGERIMKIKFRVWDKRNNRMIMPRKFATIRPVIDFNGSGSSSNSGKRK